MASSRTSEAGTSPRPSPGTVWPLAEAVAVESDGLSALEGLIMGSTVDADASGLDAPVGNDSFRSLRKLNGALGFSGFIPCRIQNIIAGGFQKA